MFYVDASSTKEKLIECKVYRLCKHKSLFKPIKKLEYKYDLNTIKNINV